MRWLIALVIAALAGCDAGELPADIEARNLSSAEEAAAVDKIEACLYRANKREDECAARCRKYKSGDDIESCTIDCVNERLAVGQRCRAVPKRDRQ